MDLNHFYFAHDWFEEETVIINAKRYRKVLNSFMMMSMQPLLQVSFVEPGLGRMGPNSHREKHHCISTPTI